MTDLKTWKSYADITKEKNQKNYFVFSQFAEGLTNEVSKHEKKSEIRKRFVWDGKTAMTEEDLINAHLATNDELEAAQQIAEDIEVTKLFNDDIVTRWHELATK